MNRIAAVANHVSGKDTLTVKDNRTGKEIEVKIKDATIPRPISRLLG
jgi:hypothetical protein